MKPKLQEAVRTGEVVEVFYSDFSIPYRAYTTTEGQLEFRFVFDLDNFNVLNRSHEYTMLLALNYSHQIGVIKLDGGTSGVVNFKCDYDHIFIIAFNKKKLIEVAAGNYPGPVPSAGSTMK